MLWVGLLTGSLALYWWHTRSTHQLNDEVRTLRSRLVREVEHTEEHFKLEMQETELRLRTLLDAMREAVLVTGPRGNVRMVNQALRNFFGDAELGRSVLSTIRSPELHDAVERAHQGRASELELDLYAGDQLRQFQVQATPLTEPDGGVAGVIVILQDISALRAAEKVRRDFVVNASHEIRTPLTAIRGFAETLQDGAVHDPAVRDRFLSSIVENSIRLERLVDDLFALSSAESPDLALEFSPVDVVALTSTVLKGLEAQAAEKRITMWLEDHGHPVFALADAYRLDQVLVNLVGNAIKYTPEGGRVWVEIQELGSHPRAVSLAVHDTGRGIAPQQLPRLFERFYRVDAGRSRDRGGTGLGLAITKHLVHRMQGEITVQSALGNGSVFRVTLPHAAPDDRAHAQSEVV